MILIKGGHVVPGDGRAESPVADVLVADGVIVDIAASEPGLGGGLVAGDGVDVIDATGMVVMPGLVDGHRHVWQAPLRGCGPDMTLPDYLETVLGRALRAYRPEDTRLATVLGAAEALNAGITTVFDWSNTTMSAAHTDAVVDGFLESGIRAIIGHTEPDNTADVRRLAQRTGRVTGALAILGCEYGPWEDAECQIRLGRELGLVTSMHATGDAATIQRMHAENLLGPHLQLVHINAVSAGTASLLAATGTGVTVTPVVEATMGHGVSAYGRLWEASIRAGLGSDVVVNSTVDLFESIRDTLRTRRLGTGGPRPAAGLLAAATMDSARAIGVAEEVGSLAVGKRADIVLLDGFSHLTGQSADVAGAVVTSANPGDVHTVLVDGQVVKRSGRLLHHDLVELRYRAVDLVRRAFAR